MIVQGLTFAIDGTPDTLVFEGKTYRVLRTDSVGALRVAFDVDSGTPANFNGNYAAAQTDLSIISAPGAGLRIYVTGIVFSTHVAGTFKLHEDTSGGTRRFGPHYFGVDGGISHPNKRPPLIFGVNKPVRITTDIAGNHSIDLDHYTGA